ncbi:MAG TPA: molybdate ABC transporter substrate-binding protein [Desulfurobacteriaceae bacterium]|nr:molybdate ABC transporter substrate-binding protein [Desulfurobacteriaceae bacterium]
MGKFYIILFFSIILNLSYAQTILVSAATSTQKVLKDIIFKFEKENNNCKIILNSGASGKLAFQIFQGAPVDIFISASKSWIDFLEAKNLIKGKKIFAKNALVLVTYSNSSFNSLQDIFKAKVIAIGNYKFAPFGKYAYEVLNNLGYWDKLKDKFVYANNVNQALSYLISKNVDFSIIYYTDYLKAKNKLKLIYVFPSSLHSPINYYLALIKRKNVKLCAKNFYKYLTSNETRKVLKSYGFSF